MNNFVFGAADPLLYSNIMPKGSDALYVPETDIKRQLDSVMQQYQQLQQAKGNEQSTKDWIGEFDNALKSLDPNIANALMEDQEFVQLNAIVQQDIQNEIMMSIKWKLNSKQDTVHRVKRLIDIIDNYNRDKANEDKKNIAELTDYIQNYSDMTFNEYKKLKSAQ
jgi:prefoldin subunit 5